MTHRKPDLAHEVEAREDLHESTQEARWLRSRLKERQGDPTATSEGTNLMEIEAEYQEGKQERARKRLEDALLRRRTPRGLNV